MLLQRASNTGAAAAAAVAAAATVNRESVHLKLIEKVIATVKRDGNLESAEIAGSVNLNIADPAFNTITLSTRNEDAAYAQLQAHPHFDKLLVHPHLDKAAWQAEAVLRLKSAQKPFPPNRDIDIIKWKVPFIAESALPLTRRFFPSLNCIKSQNPYCRLLAVTVWPNESSNGCTVNIEYTLQIERLALSNVEITIPLP